MGTSTTPHTMIQAALLLLAGMCLMLPAAYADDVNHKYTNSEEVKVWANKVGPYHNPQESYMYHSLPFCRPSKHEQKPRTLGDALEGNSLLNTGIALQFKARKDNAQMCTVTLNADTASSFNFAVLRQYWYQLYVDELPVWAMVGEVAEAEHAVSAEAQTTMIYTHMKFDIGYNGDRIVQVNLTSEAPRPIVDGAELTFSFAVQWHQSETTFEDRFRRYLDYSFFEHQIHSFSILNSFMMVIFLVGLVSLILLRTLRQDYAAIFKDAEGEMDELDRDLADETGWKKIHGDVFRDPVYWPMLCTMVGVGYQLLLMMFGVLFCALVGTLYVGRGAVLNLVVFFYALTSFASGYKSGSMYAQSRGQQWKSVMIATAVAFPAFLMAVAIALNVIAHMYQAILSVHYGSMATVVAIWCVTALPLTVVGTMLGRNWNGVPDLPCRISTIPGYLPSKKWFLEWKVMIPAGGVLPFGSIFIEMYFVFSSFWNYKFYYVYGFMFLVMSMLIIVCACVAIVATYFLLNAEDYHWHWNAFLSVASTSIYVLCYAIYFYYSKTRMHGFFQISFYCGYVLVFCVTMFVMCGTVGFLGANTFVRRIYRDIKSD